MNEYLLMLTLVGLAGFSMAWMPQISKVTGISYSVFYLLAGMLLYWALQAHLPDPLPQHNPSLTLHLSELIVIISLMGAGIKIDRAFSFKKWGAPFRLIWITMTLCMAVTALAGYYFLGLGVAASLLLAAILAPTDPVLASDVQVGPPNHPERSDTKFVLTAEAGLNDGIAFPFTWLAVTVGMMGAGQDASLLQWFGLDFLYRILAGIAIGFAAGKAIGYLVFNMAKRYRFLSTNDGLLAVTATLLVYGLTEFAHGYGFIAVFICAITLRQYEKHHEYHQQLHSYTDQTERFLICVLLLVFGGIIVGGILAPLTWPMAVFVLGFLLVVRPLTGYLALWNKDLERREKRAISFFGIRGMGSIFYLAFGIKEFDFMHQDELWAIVAFAILISIILHGISANPAMERLRKKRGQG